MAVQIQWAPDSTTVVTTYVVERSGDRTGPWTFLADVPNTRDVGNTYYRSTPSPAFVFTDDVGTAANWYRVSSVGPTGLRTTGGPIPAIEIIPVNQTDQTRVTSDYPTAGALSYVTSAGAPVAGATVRAFRAPEYDSGGAAPVALTLTTAEGTWRDALYLTRGYTYVIQFAKEGSYGPDSTRISV